MFCQNCGCPLRENAKFCHVCGAEQIPEDFTPAPQPEEPERSAPKTPAPESPPAAQTEAISLQQLLTMAWGHVTVSGELENGVGTVTIRFQEKQSD